MTNNTILILICALLPVKLSGQVTTDSPVNRIVYADTTNIRSLPDPAISISTFAVRADLENFHIEGIPVKVVKFTLSVLRKGKAPLVFPHSGNLYNRETLLTLERLNPDDKIIVDNISIQYACSKAIRPVTTSVIQTWGQLVTESRRVR